MEKPKYKIIFVTCATKQTKDYYRLYNKLKAMPELYNDGYYHIHTLGTGQEWLGGDMKSPGGGHKLNLMKDFLTDLKNEAYKPNVYLRTGESNFLETIICFVDAYDVLPNTIENFESKLVERFLDFKKDIVFGAEPYCYPVWERKRLYPETNYKNKYLNSGMYIGYAPSILNLLENTNIKNNEDDQLFYTDCFLNQKEEVSIGLDYSCKLFFNLHGNLGSYAEQLKVYGNSFYNKDEGEIPFFIHANGTREIKNFLDSVTSRNELDFDATTGVKTNLYDYEKAIDSEKEPLIRLVLRVEAKNDFLGFLNSVYGQRYDKAKISLCILADNQKLVDDISSFFSDKQEYREFWVGTTSDTDDAIVGGQCDVLANYNKGHYGKDTLFNNFIFLKNDIIMKDEFTLKYIVHQNNGVFTIPIVTSGDSNFVPHNDTTYEFMKQYVSGRYIVRNISSLICVNGYTFIDDLVGTRNIADTMVEKYHFLEVLTGLVMVFHNSTGYVDVEIVEETVPEENQAIEENEVIVTTVEDELTIRDYTNPLWEAKYLKKSLTSMNWELNTIEVHPNSDIITVPAFTEAFCKELIEEVEKANMWEDKRHSSYPAEDVLLEKVGLSDMYNYVLEKYVYPLAIHNWSLEGEDWKKMYPETFVNRYRTDGQDGLAIHHDSSIYTVLVTLNRDFDGGGTIFPSKKLLHKGNVGDLTIHPGFLTHKHGGKPIDSGTRYVLVSFCKKRKYITVGDTTYWVQYP